MLGGLLALVPANAASAAPNVAGEYHTLTPARILDTRDGTGAPRAPLGPGGNLAAALTLQVTGRGGVPASGVTAVVMNVTVTNTNTPQSSFLTVWPTGEAQPNVSSLNWVSGQEVPNLVTVKVGTGGAVSFANAFGTTDVIADVVGWYDDASAAGGGWFNPLTPTRILDTRDGTGAPSAAPVGPAGTLTLQVTGRGGVPAAAGVSAVVMNVTAADPTVGGFLTVWPGGPLPKTSNLNFVGGIPAIANLVTVGVSPTGMVSIYNALGQTHVIADVVGWYDQNGSQGTVFNAVSPIRALDTRDGPPGGQDQGPFVNVTQFAGLPTNSRAVVANVTATDTTADSYLTVWPSNQPRPNASNLNWRAGQTVPNLVVSPIAPQSAPAEQGPGHIAVYNFVGQVHVLVDVVGYFVPGPAPA
jgi:hypothetical protein